MASQKYCLILVPGFDGRFLCQTSFVVIRYYSISEKKIVTSLLNLIPVIQAIGEDLFQALKCSLDSAGLSLRNCVGYACDGAAIMVSEHNSVWSRIKQESPNWVLFNCICHSLHKTRFRENASTPWIHAQ